MVRSFGQLLAGSTIPRICLYLGDVVALQLAVFLSWLGRSLLDPWLGAAMSFGQYQTLTLIILAFPLIYGVVGLYPGYELWDVERLRRRVYASICLFLLLILWDYMVQKDHNSRLILSSALLITLLLGPIVEMRLRHILIRYRQWGKPVIIIGAGPAAGRLVQTLRQEPELGLIPVVAYDDDPTRWGQAIEGVPIAGSLSQAARRSRTVSTAAVAVADITAERYAILSQKLRFPRLIVVPDLSGVSSLHTSSRMLGGMIALEVKQNLMQRRHWFFKRMLDHVLSVLICLPSLLILAVAAIAIKIVSPQGPVFFHQKRVGFGGRMIKIWKLRTMYPDANRRLEEHLVADPEAREEWDRNCKLADDPRLLPLVGRFLRRSSLDELPQIWNVLRGDMSLVGPRPLPRYHLDRFTPEFRHIRRQVRPGITGLWQVSARGNGTQEMHEQLDCFYITNWSPWLDIHILFRTVLAVVHGRGAC
ncbi:MAG: exopolysaccharide biosynthesis polyprenyl glycosylphosphotransferase [Phycisphaeraceae bacterium]|nr:exopolysaccharide biosynthesis polyprenyl glycosylphosphotransferase [Phycisphaeraceae bacterium]